MVNDLQRALNNYKAYEVAAIASLQNPSVTLIPSCSLRPLRFVFSLFWVSPGICTGKWQILCIMLYYSNILRAPTSGAYILVREER